MPVLSDYLAGIDPGGLEDFLRRQQEPVFESQLLQQFCPELDLLDGSAIELYRWHFALFHQLYRLKDELYHRGQHLHVHFMAIFLSELPKVGLCRHYCGESHCFCAAPVAEPGVFLCKFHHHATGETALTELSDRYFYLDEANFAALRAEDAEAFIAGAWNLLQNYGEVEQCYRILGMPVNSELKLVKLHFRKLAKEYHPDLHPHLSQEFSRLNSAYRRLVNFLSIKRF